MKQLIAVLLCLTALPAWSATCTVTELRSLVTDANGRIVEVALFSSVTPPTTQLVTYTTATAITNAFQLDTRFLMLNCSASAHFQLGTTPATGLTTADPRLSEGTTYIGVVPTEAALGTLKIAFYDGTS
jgi:hypothetical protein